MWAVLLPDLLLHVKFHMIQVDAVAAFVRNGLTVDSSVDGSNMLNSLIELYDQRVQDIVIEPLNGFGEEPNCLSLPLTNTQTIRQALLRLCASEYAGLSFLWQV